jgi:hypothetical protein
MSIIASILSEFMYLESIIFFLNENENIMLYNHLIIFNNRIFHKIKFNKNFYLKI